MRTKNYPAVLEFGLFVAFSITYTGLYIFRIKKLTGYIRILQDIPLKYQYHLLRGNFFGII